jgi:fluoride ion exporter CrcB/FEX
LQNMCQWYLQHCSASSCPYSATTCPVGTYASGTETVCDPCSTGKYNDQQGQTSESTCESCATGKYNDQPGQSSCTPCGAGKYNDQQNQTSESSCTQCAASKYNGLTNQTDESACLSCSTNAKCENGKCKTGFDHTSGCTTCLPQRYGSNCDECPERWVSFFTDGMIGGVGLYSLFAMLYLFYYHANNIVEVEDASIKADRDAQDDAGDANELGTTIIRKEKVRTVGTSMRRILVNQVSAKFHLSVPRQCIFVNSFSSCFPISFTVSIQDANFIRHYPLDNMESLFTTGTDSICQNYDNSVYHRLFGLAYLPRMWCRSNDARTMGFACHGTNRIGWHFVGLGSVCKMLCFQKR